MNGRWWCGALSFARFPPPRTFLPRALELPPATMMTGPQTADRAKLIQSGTMEGLGQDVAKYVQFVLAPTARRRRMSNSTTFREDLFFVR